MMAQVDVLLRVVLGLVFATAGVAKLLSADTDDVLAAFGLPRRLALAVRALPWVELTVPAALVTAVTARAGALAASILLIVFSVLQVRNMAAGRAGNCNCFGSLHRSRPGWRSLVRNVLLLAASCLVLGLGRQPGWRLVQRDLEFLRGHAAVVGGSGAIVFLGLAAAWRLGHRPPAVPPDAGEHRGWPWPVPLTTLDGGMLTSVAVHGDMLLVFVDPHCRSCRSVLPALHSWWAHVPPGALLVVTRGDPSVNREVFQLLPPDRVVIDMGGALARAYGVTGTPSGVVLPAGDRPAKVVTGSAAIEVLLRRLADAPSRRALRRGRRPDPLVTAADGAVLTASSRRDVFRAAGTVAGLALATAACGAAGGKRSTGGTRSTAQTVSNGKCPACGTCVDCNLVGTVGSGTPTLRCNPCAQVCSASELCTSNAVTSPEYNALVSYLGSEGYNSDGEPVAVAFSSNASTEAISLVSVYTGTAGRATLTYTLTGSGGSSNAVFVDAQGQPQSFAQVSPSGQVMRTPVAPYAPPAGTTGTTGTTGVTGVTGTTGGGTTGTTGTTGAGLTAAVETVTNEKCKSTCGFYVGAITLVFETAVELALAEDIFALDLFLMLAAFTLNQLGEVTPAVGAGVPGFGLGTLLSVYAALKEGDIGGAANAVRSSQLEHSLCDMWCSAQLCCNSTGACFDELSTCNQNCPGGLAHPDAACLVYIDGKPITQIFPGGI